jgi:hypothetical protein
MSQSSRAVYPKIAHLYRGETLQSALPPRAGMHCVQSRSGRNVLYRARDPGRGEDPSARTHARGQPFRQRRDSGASLALLVVGSLQRKGNVPGLATTSLGSPAHSCLASYCSSISGGSIFYNQESCSSLVLKKSGRGSIRNRGRSSWPSGLLP